MQACEAGYDSCWSTSTPMRVDLRRAGRVEDAVAGQAGDLEQDVEALVLGDELVTERLASGLVGEADLEKSLSETNADLTTTFGLTDLAPSS